MPIPAMMFQRPASAASSSRWAKLPSSTWYVAAHNVHLDNTKVVLSCTNLPCAILLCIAIAVCLLALQALISLHLPVYFNVSLT